MEIPPRRSRTKPPEWWDRRFRRSKNSTHSEIMYKQVKFRFLTALFLALPAPAADLIDFNTQIHPILAARCLVCHSQEKRSGGLSLATLKTPSTADAAERTSAPAAPLQPAPQTNHRRKRAPHAPRRRPAHTRPDRSDRPLDRRRRPALPPPRPPNRNGKPP